MPLIKGSSKAVMKQNFREFGKGKTFKHTQSKFGLERALSQRIAVVLKQAGKGNQK
jgi:hypothetical protein